MPKNFKLNKPKVTSKLRSKPVLKGYVDNSKRDLAEKMRDRIMRGDVGGGRR